MLCRTPPWQGWREKLLVGAAWPTSSFTTTANSSLENPRISLDNENDSNVPDLHDQIRNPLPLVAHDEAEDPCEWGGTLGGESKLAGTFKTFLTSLESCGVDQFHSEEARKKTPKLKSKLLVGSFSNTIVGGKKHGIGPPPLATRRSTRSVQEVDWEYGQPFISPELD
ncbi:unnamed protein product [Linum trigynum]|uniref:Uncharacterized protein n=1 Tax=Linum trigynum TaxID=586398 RepID=A0AAV2DDM8_9ROSI